MTSTKVDVCRFDAAASRRTHRFPNRSVGHQALLDWLGPEPSEIVVESTGRYSLDLALALHETNSIELMVANPNALRGFAKAQMRRTKTDVVDAKVIADYTRRMQGVGAAYQGRSRPPVDRPHYGCSGS